jgi:hypothetical protein
MADMVDLIREGIGAADDSDAELVLQEHFRRDGLTDGLPIVIPTVKRVDAFIRDSGFAPGREVGPVPPSFGVATVANVAVNAVMAGAKPEHLGVILTSIEAQLDPVFNLAGIQVTTNPCAPLTIVNGPVRHRLGVDSGGHAYSGGANANGVIGRAIRLALRNIGDAKGEVDRSTLGMPSKFSFVLAENEEASPWEPLHVSLGFEASQDVVTVTAPEAIIDTCRPTFDTVEPLIWDYSELMKSVGTNKIHSTGTLLWVVPPYQARLFAEVGWTRETLQQRLFDDAWFPVDPWFDPSTRRGKGALKDIVGEKKKITGASSDIYLMVAGRDDPLHATYLPSVTISRAASRTVWTP